jgi:hypothetical protein
MTDEITTPAKTEGRHQWPPIVYLVDNDLSFLRALSRILRAADYRVETFGSAEGSCAEPQSNLRGLSVVNREHNRLKPTTSAVLKPN